MLDDGIHIKWQTSDYGDLNLTHVYVEWSNELRSNSNNYIRNQQLIAVDGNINQIVIYELQVDIIKSIKIRLINRLGSSEFSEFKLVKCETSDCLKIKTNGINIGLVIGLSLGIMALIVTITLPMVIVFIKR